MEKPVLYDGQLLTLTRFWGNQKPCLWIHNPSQRGIPKMEFVGGYPNEYCIFLEKLSPKELAQITSTDGTPINLETELENLV